MTRQTPQPNRYPNAAEMAEADKIFRTIAEKFGGTVSRRFYKNGHEAITMSHRDPETGRIITEALYVVGFGTGFDGKIEKKFFFPKRKPKPKNS